jgi:hypothetical protein
MDDDFGVGIGDEDVTHPFQLLAQRFVVFDDAVVHYGEVVARKMWMSVALARCSVGGPTGVRNAQATCKLLVLLRLLQLGDLAGTAQTMQACRVVQHGDTGAVVATVFQALEAFEQDCGDVTFSDGANDATHGQDS